MPPAEITRRRSSIPSVPPKPHRATTRPQRKRPSAIEITKATSGDEFATEVTKRLGFTARKALPRGVCSEEEMSP